ncbi:hypothetical protein PTTG_27529 [Puccinia triticina 1-1 BBBD Race 1]|uniref:Secreted protein n=2 Tax=Puccinia triticina TaxID=208348 RepID=A0A180GJX7_PUCT1|nr:uncharacterized protein PtA15_3A440 [Puccinia triticina]OAV92759.1 hypothetical protein PTTG_27529 [Puccinia triticina 1-1 BBBD Race 1]WAQ83073.1 hypothetical protein PtA15_3A440 [Puccinia triticina]WAR53911.1 hypothetical protein PtB15_3B420 [Puccinia triticina]
MHRFIHAIAVVAMLSCSWLIAPIASFQCNGGGSHPTEKCLWLDTRVNRCYIYDPDTPGTCNSKASPHCCHVRGTGMPTTDPDCGKANRWVASYCLDPS